MDRTPDSRPVDAPEVAHAPSADAPSADAPTAFERLMLPHLGDVARFARALARDPGAADDLVQETYLQALRGWHTFRPDADPRRWLFTICRNAFLRGARRELRYVAAPDDDPELEALAAAREHGAALRDGTARQLDHLDLAPAVARALAALPAHYRVAVVLVDVEGCDYAEAAAQLGTAVGTVRSRLFRGRRLLQQALYAHARDLGVVRDGGAGVARPDDAPAPGAARREGPPVEALPPPRGASPLRPQP